MKFWAFNCTRQTLLASEVELADTGWARMKGLLGRKAAEFGNGKGLWIAPSEGIHTIGMSFAIDVVYLSADYRVLRIYHRLAPFRIAAVQLKSSSVIELPAGTLARTRTQVGDLLQFSTAEEDEDHATGT
jgi:uncharacterized membrane protein (UPF0127 family)